MIVRSTARGARGPIKRACRGRACRRCLSPSAAPCASSAPRPRLPWPPACPPPAPPRGQAGGIRRAVGRHRRAWQGTVARLRPRIPPCFHSPAPRPFVAAARPLWPLRCCSSRRCHGGSGTGGRARQRTSAPSSHWPADGAPDCTCLRPRPGTLRGAPARGRRATPAGVKTRGGVGQATAGQLAGSVLSPRASGPPIPYKHRAAQHPEGQSALLPRQVCQDARKPAPPTRAAPTVSRPHHPKQDEPLKAGQPTPLLCVSLCDGGGRGHARRLYYLGACTCTPLHCFLVGPTRVAGQSAGGLGGAGLAYL